MGPDLLSAGLPAWFTGTNWSFGVVTVCAVCLTILIANVIRRKVPFMRRSLMPTAVIAGLLGLLVKEIVAASTRGLVDGGFQIFDQTVLAGVVYHTLPVGFIALCLREKDDYAYEFDKTKAKHRRVSGTKSGALIISTYLGYALVGIAVTVICSLFMSDLNPATGIMLALGYGQGPQQAMATGGIWDANNYMNAWGPNAAVNFGITVAAFGFLWASIPGIILVNRIAKKKGLQLHRNEYEKSGDMPAKPIEGPDEIPLSESIDKFTIQVCMIAGVYLATIGIIVLIDIGLTASGVTFLQNLIPTIWGFGFMLAVGVALITKVILKRLVKKKVMKRIYPNSYMMNRIAGVAFDVSIVAALFMIDTRSLGTLWIPVLLMSCIGGIAAIFGIRFLCNKIYKDYKDEAFLAFYGMQVGTIANGMILLREIDRNFTTPAADDLVIGSSGAIVMGFPLLLLIAQAPAGNNLWWVTLAIAGYLAVLLTYLYLSTSEKIKQKRALKKGTAVAGADTGKDTGLAGGDSAETDVANGNNQTAGR